MFYSDADDEDWYDDESDFGDEETVPCPECGVAVSSVTDKCPACGYWLSEDDRRAAGINTGKPLWLKVTAAVVLAAFLISVLGLAGAIF